MKLLNFGNHGNFRLGIEVNSKIFDIEKAREKHSSKDIPVLMSEILRDPKEKMNNINTFINDLGGDIEQYLIDKEKVEWGPAITNPEKIICVGLNYAKHADESNLPHPSVPIIFNKFNNSLAGHKQHIHISEKVKQVDYEAELAIVIGKYAKDIPKEEALDYVFGYAVSNDLSSRDLQMRTSQWMLGKTSDGFCPIGPYVVTADSIENPNNLQIKLSVNGEERQSSNTKDMIFSCEEIISYISQYMTLKTGDIILTGTPEGVVLGYPEEEREFLTKGDQIEVEIEELGKLINTIK